MKINIRFIGGLQTSKNHRQIVLVEEPHIQSMANLVLLKHYYLRRLAVDPGDFKVYLRFRNKFLKDQKRIHGRLTCVYCGKTNLTANVNSHSAKGREATLDHIKPLFLGGKKFDPENCAVACLKCNHAKGAMTVEEFTSEL